MFAAVSSSLRLAVTARHFSSSASSALASAAKRAMVKVGDSLPSVQVYENDAKTTVDIAELFKGKKGILFGVPGAFTPGCSKTHLPGYVKDYEKLKAKGAEVIAVIAVNDGFVMQAWGAAHNAEGKVRMLADPTAELTKALGLEFNAPPLGGLRTTRFSAVLNDGVFTHVNIEPSGGGLTCSLANVIYDQL
ncbi:thioredoxin peroxidase PMP20 [Capsaspora owczarzaki ATCC 30864]|uniref:Thioredoxin peroxidase PMP20 n=1 Tax=Capsaspora owczarzaki (strain ATCC 30864) TaxID=595528 RepID=A0A0D2X3T7_CAPO3|nr:thioredoxin peroxidase PMP20 [Capsaspora owczarzaki ATCC 30864]KJE94879.1 thioredoxin peroxidase PMP20 [Capsaspora owczarzaki ATCC 30864]|eukprot:XP_004346112.1 thioredoxin peroxidase PMP20 [Capsaspora owczarzaki ATCC 30864]